MDQYLKNRFSDFDDLSISELEILKEKALQEISFYLDKLEDKNVSSYQKSEFRESDLKFERDKLEYIEYLIQEKTKHKHR